MQIKLAHEPVDGCLQNAVKDSIKVASFRDIERYVMCDNLWCHPM